MYILRKYSNQIRRLAVGVTLCFFIIFYLLTQTSSASQPIEVKSVQSDVAFADGKGTLYYNQDLALYVEPPPKPKPKYLFSRPLPNWCGHYERGFSSSHKGVDLAQGSGCQELADAWGIITQTGFTSGGCGWTIVIDHKNGWTSTYCHGNGTQYVKNGATVYQGQPIQFMGMSGNATGVHLHYVIKKNGIEINPSIYNPFLR